MSAALGSAVLSVAIGVILVFLLSLQLNLYGAVWKGLQRFDTLNLMRGAAGTLQTAGASVVEVAFSDKAKRRLSVASTFFT